MDKQEFYEILEAIKDSLKEVKESTKEMQKDISGIKDSQHEMREDIGIHIYRTNLLEEDLKRQKEDNKEEFKLIKEELEPLKKDNWKLKGAIGLVLGLAALLELLRLLKLL